MHAEASIQMIAKRIVRYIAGFPLFYLCACGMPVENASPLHENPQSWEEFRAAVHRESFEHGVFIVDGDIPISDETELRTYYDTHVAQLNQALTVKNVLGADILWREGNRFNLTYCISNGFGARKATVVSEMQAATQSWSARIGVGFRYVPEEDFRCDAQNTNVLFDVSPSGDWNYFARAFFPDDSRPTRRLLITNEAFTTTAGGRDFQGILRHELGHALGFRHEHIWWACTGESTSDARQVTTYDEFSVMHYPQCRTVNAGGYRQTETDYRGAISLYGLAPALIMTVQ
jgi:hypothetical protein